jgi:hypothetical protein
VVVSPESGERLFAAAGEPKDLWTDPDVGHAGFLQARPSEFDKRVNAFLDKYLQ